MYSANSVKSVFSLSIAALLLFSAFSVLIGMPPTARAVEFTPNPVPVTTTVNIKESLDMAVSDDGRIYISWSERANDNIDVYFSHSSNNGTTFSPKTRVNSQTLGSQKSSQIAVSNNSVYIVWEDSMADSGDIVLARSDDGGLTFQEVHVSDYENGTQSNPTVAASGNQVAVAWEEYRSDNTIRIWDGVNGKLIRGLVGHKKAVRDVEFSPDGARIGSASEDGTAKIWDASTGALIATLSNHTHNVTAINWSADGKMLATGSWDHNVLLLNSTTYGVIKVLNHTSIQTKNFVNALSFSQDSSKLAVAYNGDYGDGFPTGSPTQNYNLTVWNMTGFSNWTRSPATPDPDKGHTNSVMDVAFSHDGKYLASVSKDYTLKIWNSSTGQRIENVFLGHFGQAVSWSPDDGFLAVGLGNGSIAIINQTNIADITWMTNQHTGNVNSLDWSVVRNEILSGASDPIARVWDQISKKERLNLTEHWNSVYSVDWSSSGQHIVTAGGMSEQYGMKENQIFCALSHDGGITFSSPIMVADSCAQNRLRPKIDMDSSGTISAVWYDFRNGNSNIYFANSTDAGAMFNANVGIDTSSSECTTPRIFVEDSGKSHIVWQYGLGAGVMYSNSTDGFAVSRVVALNAQVPIVSGSPDGSSIWVGWRGKNQTTNFSTSQAAISYNGGANFTETVQIHSSSTLISEHSLFIDKYNQTFVAWEIGQSIYHRSTVLSDVWAPSVLSTSPVSGETDVSIFTSFMIRFSEPMNRGVTEASFSWTDGTSTWNVGNCVGNKGTWNAYGDTVSFKPREPLQYQKTGYSFRVNSTASDLAGNLLGQNMIFTFTTSADTDPPTIEYHPSQATVSYEQEYNVMAIIKDQWGVVDNAMLFYQGVADTSPTRSILMSLSGTDTYQASIPAQQSLGTIFYFIKATDAYNNMAWSPVNYTNHSQLYAVEVVDGVRPEISHVPVIEADVFREIEIWAVVMDGVQLRDVNLNYRAIGSFSYTMIAMQPVNATPNTFRYMIPAQNSTGMVHYNISAVDASGNFNSTDFISIRILDSTAPLINAVIPNLLDNQTRVLVRANVTDDVEVGSVVLYFKAVGGDAWVSRQMTHVSGDIYEFTIPAQRRSGFVYYYVNATDSSGNQASTLFEQDQFQVEVEGVDEGVSIYYVLGGVLVVLMILLVLLLIRKFSGPAKANEKLPEDSGEINEPEPPEEAEQDNDAP
jgi:WD40 repeat protein